MRLATLDGKAIRGWDEGDWAREVDADLALGDVAASDYDAIALPGGQIDPKAEDRRRRRPSLARLRRGNKVVAAICHGPWMLVEGDVVRGREVTSYPSHRPLGTHSIELVAPDGIVISRNPATSTPSSRRSSRGWKRLAIAATRPERFCMAAMPRPGFPGIFMPILWRGLAPHTYLVHCHRTDMGTWCHAACARDLIR